MDQGANVANRVPITAAMMLATMMSVLDSTIANVALPHMQGSFGAAQDQISWILTSFIIATAIMTPLSGWLALKVGRRPMFLISIAGFTLASMLCGIAQSLPEMVAFRLIQGCAGAGMMPLSQTVMLDLFPLRQLPVVMSVWSSVIVLGPILGPTAGGWLTENLSWRWCFYINLPFGILSFLGVYLFMSGGDHGRERPFDFLGFGSLVAFVGAFQLMMDRGPTQDWFSSTEIWTEAIVAMIAFWVFIVQTITAEHPFFHRDIAKDRNFVTCTFFSVFNSGLLFSTSALLPTLMQNLLGYSAMQSGMVSMARGVGSFVGFAGVPFIVNRLPPRLVLTVGLCMSIFGLWQMSKFDLSMTAAPIISAGIIQGIGMSMVFAPLNVFSWATLNPAHRTEATVVATMIRSLGSSIGISGMQAALVGGQALAHARLADKIVTGDPMVSASLPAIMDPATEPGLMALNGDVTRQATMISYDSVFAWMALAALCVFPLLFLMRPPPPQPPLEVTAETAAAE